MAQAHHPDHPDHPDHPGESGLTERSTPQVLTSLIGNMTNIVRTEIQLARAEIGDKADQARSGAIGTALGTGILLLGVVFLILSAIAALAEFTPLDFWASSLIIGGLITIVGFILLKSGSNKLKPKNLEPKRTEQGARRSAALVKETLQ